VNVDDGITTQYLSGFSQALRQEGLNITPYHTSTFLTASRFIRLEHIDELYWAGRATLIEHVDNVPVFDTVFEEYFRFQGNKVLLVGDGEQREAEGDDDSGSVESISRRLEQDSIEFTQGDISWKKASDAETLKTRHFLSPDENDLIYVQKIISLVSKLCPQKKTRRYRTHRKGKLPDLRGSIGQLPRTDGEMIRMLRKKKRTSKKSILILIDVSGSMTMQLQANILFAYALMQGHSELECFCLGTRLTCISNALKNRQLDVALENVSHAVLDWDGGTRLGDGVCAFLAQANNLALVRGADVFILSDGLERGDPGKLIYGARRLSQNSQHVHWISPLAGAADYRPATRAMQVIVPMLGNIYSGADIQQLYASLHQIWRARAN
jgi:uncharacterized protein